MLDGIEKMIHMCPFDLARYIRPHKFHNKARILRPFFIVVSYEKKTHIMIND